MGLWSLEDEAFMQGPKFTVRPTHGPKKAYPLCRNSCMKVYQIAHTKNEDSCLGDNNGHKGQKIRRAETCQGSDSDNAALVTSRHCYVDLLVCSRRV